MRTKEGAMDDEDDDDTDPSEIPMHYHDEDLRRP